MENKAHALVAGIFTLLLGLAVVLTMFWLGGQHETTREFVVVTKQNVGGLNAQAQVRYRGIRVGKVTDIRLDPEDAANILISIAVRDDIPLTTRTIAKMGYQGVTGLSHIQLEEAGEAGRPLVSQAGHPPRIAMMPSMIEALGETGATTLQRANELLVNANLMFNEENRRRFSSSLSNLESASGSLKPTLDQLNVTLTQVSKALDDENVAHLKKAAAEVGPLLADTRILIGKLQLASDKVDAAIGDSGGHGAAALLPRLNEMTADFSATSRQLNRVLRLVEDAPQSLIFGAPPVSPGPGEPGFIVREAK